MISRIRAAALLGALALAACVAETQQRSSAPVDPLAMPSAGDWPSDGRDYTAQRYSPLTQIDADNVSQLGLAWYDDLDTYRGVEATPIYADGVLYNTLPWNITTAYDARTGAKLWTYDPQVPREYGRYACCEPDARGLAMWQGRVIIATLDGRLIALDAKTGKELWTTQTFTHDMAYTITGAPRVFGDMVVIGNSGGDLGVRGFVAAFDAATGKKRWKFFLTPNPDDKPDGEASDPMLPMMRKTWSDNGMWKTLGGGANPWDSIAYDPENKLVFVGTGNSVPHTQYYRSEDKGDNLFVCSIVALHAEDGSYAWHYQMVPGEEWDWTCTSSIISADLTIDGKPRQVIMQAPKDGYFYVLDRKSGELISAQTHVKINWSLGLDPKTGRPNVNPAVRYGTDPVLVYPGPGGAHNWFPMAYSPKTGLAYFPAYQSGFVYARQEGWTPQPFRSNSGWGGFSGDALKKRLELQKIADADEKAMLTAWDPVKQKAAWQVPLPRHGNGGVFVTASNLVFEGNTRQTFAAFDALTGKQLWEFPTQSAPVAGGITYEVGGEQYVAIDAGWGGGAAQIERGAGIELPRAPARLMVFKLGGTRALPPLAAQEAVPNPPPMRGSEAQIQRGAKLFADTCAQCHGQLAIGGVRDLRHMTSETHGKFNDIVLKGIYQDKGMGNFSDLISPDDAEAIHDYLIARANEDWGRN
jgi:quinohemoprotein ethanol dehydrogenase